MVVFPLVSILELRDGEKARLELSYLGYQRQHRDERLKSLVHFRLESSEEELRKLSEKRIIHEKLLANKFYRLAQRSI